MTSLADIKRRLPVVWDANLSAMIWGPPGVGKSDLIRQVAASMSYSVPENNEVIEALGDRESILRDYYGKDFTGRPVKDVRLSMCTPSNLMGVPAFNPEDKVTSWFMSDLLPMDPNQLADFELTLVSLLKHGDMNNADVQAKIGRMEKRIARGLQEQHAVLFMDEITQAPQSIQAAAFQIVLDRKSGTYVMPSDVKIVAAGNRKADRAGVNAMVTPLLSRFQHFIIDIPNHAEFVEYMRENEFSHLITGFLEFRPEALFKFDPTVLTGSAETSDITFACPRTWEMTNKVLKSAEKLEKAGHKLTEVDLDETLAGLVGSGAATEFRAFVKLYMKLPSPLTVLDGQMGPEEIMKYYYNDRGVKDLSLEYAFIMSMTDIVLDAMRSGDHDLFISRASNLNKYVVYDPSAVEWGIIVFRTLAKNFKTKEELNAWKKTEMCQEVMEMADHGSVISKGHA